VQPERTGTSGERLSMGWELPLCLFRAMTFKQASSVRPEGCLVSLSGQRRNLKLVPLAIAALAWPSILCSASMSRLVWVDSSTALPADNGMGWQLPHNLIDFKQILLSDATKLGGCASKMVFFVSC